jgi:hypothetical protein
MERGIRGGLTHAPSWVIALFSGTVFGLGMFGWQVVDGASVPAAALACAICGVAFGAVTGRSTRRRNQRLLAAAGDPSLERLRLAGRATVRGPIPTDPELRRTAAAIAAYRLAELRRQWWAAPMFLALIALATVQAFTSSPWWALAALGFAGFLVLHRWTARRLRLRQPLLAAAER